MPFKKRETSARTLGELEGNIKEATGTLIALEPSTQYQGTNNFQLKDATVVGTDDKPEQLDNVLIFGTAFMNQRIKDGDVGKRVKFTFLGESRTKAGRRAKNIECSVEE